MEFASAIIGFIEFCSRAQSRGQERAPIQIQLYVAGRRVKVVPRYALGFHLDPPPGSGAFAFRISRVENCLRQEWPAAPDGSCVRKTFQRRQNWASCPKFPKLIEDCCER